MRSPYGGEHPLNPDSPHQTASSSGSVFLPSQSPLHTPQPSRPGMLPSPSSMSIPNIANIPSFSPPSATAQTSAQATHLHDLQHQVSVKALALQTLQREYDSLLQKLERQRTKCATLEKKFEVSDVEINSLTDEKERLNAQVAMLEAQAEELQQSRDDTRKQLVDNGAQYMRIMEMANRLQAQGAEDKKRWESEKADLRQRIKVLEEAMVTGTARPTPFAATATSNEIPSIVETHMAAQESASSTETIRVLRAEIGRLRLRTQGLETALQTVKGESVAIQEAAKILMESGGKVEITAQGAMDS
jgi:chromosome segregation ATPase